MLPNKITKNFKEISKFFVENFDISANAIFTVLDILKLSDKSLCFSTNYNAKYSQTVKFILILLMPFFRIRNVLNYFFFQTVQHPLHYTILRKQKYDTMGRLFEEITKGSYV